MLAFALMLWWGAAAAGNADAAVGDVAFYYGSDVPTDQLAHFDQVVVQPDQVSARQRRALAEGVEPVAYISVGEAEDGDNVPPDVVLGRNRAWDSPVMDLASSAWRQHLLERVEALAEAGYEAVFLDTLDSYRLAVEGDAGRAEQRRGLVRLIRRLHKKHPDMALFVNRGFAVLDRIHEAVDAVVAESLYAAWDQAEGAYTDVPAADRRWLLEQLRRVRQRFDLPIIVVDYVAERQRERARAVARRIAEHGFTPYVTNNSLDMLGSGRIEVVPRRLLLLYDGANARLAESQAFEIAAPVLEYLGYRVEYRDVRQGLPEHPLAGRYAGVVAWLGQLPAGERRRLEDWIDERVHQRVPFVLLGAPLIESPSLLDALGLVPTAGTPEGELTVAARGPVAGFEGELAPRRLDVGGWRSTNDAHRVVFGFSDARGQRWDPVVLAPWGAAAVEPFILEPLVAGHQRWRIDPFAFFRQALKGPDFPAPDPTTENGRRVLTTHVDGDAFLSYSALPGRPRAATAIRERILERFDVPTTVSVVEGELTGRAEADELEAIARGIFGLDHVEPASHTYSHPYDWRAAFVEADTGARPVGDEDGERVQPGSDLAYERSLVPADYRPRLEREIDGSVAYIERRLLTPDQSVRAFLWSGEALPPRAAIERVEALGLAHLNGGNTKLTRRFPSVTGLSPHVRPTGGGPQFFAPIANENDYTNGWTGPYDGYRRVTETFELTGHPQRLKPLAIYYHFYSGTRPAGIEALRAAYSDALAREPLPLWVSEYVERVRGFHRATLARELSGAWRVRGLAGLRTLRWPDDTPPPALYASDGVAGWRDTDVGRYVHLSAPSARLVTDAADAPETARLVAANGILRGWHYRSPEHVELRLDAHRPLELTVQGPGTCRLDGAEPQRSTNDAGLHLTFADRRRLDAALVCH